MDSYLSRFSPKTALSISTFALLGACAASGSEDPLDGLPPDSGVLGPVDTGTSPALNANTCLITDEGTTRPCSCPDATQGSQACLGGMYQACKCGAPPTTVVQSLCKPGFYSGEFTGKYKPGAFGFGIVGGFIEVDIMGSGANGYPALSFTLEAKQEGGGEFTSFSVKNGCMIGSANAYGTNNPFVGLITGDLDCRTGKFSGMISGRYDLLGFGLKFDFAGTAESQFENPQLRLKDGVWNVKEPPALDGTAAGGGGGTWSAIWESAAPPSGADPCSSSSLAPDAGTSSASADAGSDAGVDAGP